jgi:4-alpha-glucanotransferase
MGGKEQHASPETLRAVIQLWGISADTDRQACEARRELELQRWREALEPVLVAWDGKPSRVSLRLPDESPGKPVSIKLRFEDGRIKTMDFPSGRREVFERADIEGKHFRTEQLKLPPLPFGYHTLELETRDRVHRALVISAPTRSYAPVESEAREWGLFLPMYAAHSERSWGAGNLADWRRLADWTAAQGGRFLATLPLLAAFLDPSCCEPSPYSPASRLFWNEFYLDILALPEFATCKKAQALVQSRSFEQRLQGFRQSRLVDYRAEAAARRRVLEELAGCFFAQESERRTDFERFLREHPRLMNYAEFRATGERLKSPWPKWELRLRYGKLQPGDFAPAASNYHLYVQWAMATQMRDLLQHCRERDLVFYLDLPLGVNSAGYDTWREQDVFAQPASAGAPPDPVFTQGQNWGFAPLHPQRLRQSGYRYVLDYLRFQMRHTGMLRIDHIMGLHRLFWIPPGLPTSQGAYVQYPADEMLAILSLESHRHQTILVGENLGTVPPAVNQAMQRHGIRGLYVVQYEQRSDERHPLRPPTAAEVASLNTHDMPPYAAFWRGLDLGDRCALGLIPTKHLKSAHGERAKLNEALARFLQREGWLDRRGATDPATMIQALVKWLAAGRAEALLINLEDLWQEEEPQNVPGTCLERPNWCRKTRHNLETLLASKELDPLLRAVGELRRGVGASRRKRQRRPA